MKSAPLTITATDGTELFVNCWLPDGDPKAVVQIAHGMAEHSQRYARFAEALTAAGYVVYANDHRGHGRTADSPDQLGAFPEQDGFATVVDDMALLTDTIRSQQPGLPVFLFGHSMGSFVSRAYLTRYADGLAGVVLSGTGADPGVMGAVGQRIALAEAKIRGRGAKSKLMNTLTFGQFNARFKPARTDFDWLSRDPAEVDKYIADPLSGNVHTAGFYADLLEGLAYVNNDRFVGRTPKALPIYLVSGEVDPVGGAKAVEAVSGQLRRLGVTNVATKVWPQGRHEILNETNRDEVTADIIAWLDHQL